MIEKTENNYKLATDGPFKNHFVSVYQHNCNFINYDKFQKGKTKLIRWTNLRIKFQKNAFFETMKSAI